MKYLAKAKRAEAYMQLSSIYAAQKAYWAENGKYATQLAAKVALVGAQKDILVVVRAKNFIIPMVLAVLKEPIILPVN